MKIQNIVKTANTNFFRIFILVFVFSFTFILRAHNYDKAPGLGQLEELAFGWAGINLIETGSPVSWSTLEYPESSLVYSGEVNFDGSEPKVFVDLHKPWLDQPPLFSLISGGSAHLFGANRNFVLPTSYMRLPVIFITFLTSILLFLIARKVSGFWTGVLTVLIYGTTPVFVLSSRMAVPENLIGCIYLLIVYLLLKFREKPHFLYLAVIPFVIGLAGLSKATGFLIAPLVLYEIFIKKYYKSAVYLVLVVSLFVGLFIYYGIYFNEGIFWRLMEIQTTRPVGFGSLGFILTTPSFDINVFQDNFYIFCMISAVFFIFGNKLSDSLKMDQGRRFVIFSLIYGIIIVAFSGGEKDLLSWYRFIFMPLFAITGAWGIIYVIKNISFATTVVSVFLFLGNRFLLVNPFRSHLSPQAFRIIFSSLVLPSLVFEWLNKRNLEIICRIILVGTLVVGIYINVIYIYNIHEINCESRSCPIGPSTAISRMYFPIFWRFLVLQPSG